MFRLGVPMLGICYGMQLLMQELGGRVEAAGAREYGRAELERSDADDPLFEGVPATQHRLDEPRRPRRPRWRAGFETVATSLNCPFAAVRSADRKVYGLQFHPEVVHTEHGMRLLENFLVRVAGLAGNWTMDEFIANELVRLRARIGDGQVVCGVSGGVDSTVVAVLLHRAIGERLHCFFVDNGVLRAGEREEVERSFRDVLGIPLVTLDESEKFLRALRGVEDPEKKRGHHRPHLRGGLRARGQQDRQRALPRAGHLVSGRDRVASRCTARRPRSRPTTTSAACPR